MTKKAEQTRANVPTTLTAISDGSRVVNHGTAKVVATATTGNKATA